MFSFGVGSLIISATAGVFTIGKLQNISINVTYENAQMRGGLDIFPMDTQIFDGAVEGSFEHADMDLSNIGRMIAESGAFASSALTITGQTKPQVFKMVLSGTTNGATSTVTLFRVYVPSLTLDFSRTEYMIPSMNFIAHYTTATGMLKWMS